MSNEAFKAHPADTIVSLMFHDDDCGALLTSDGLCPDCNFCPDMQSTGFTNASSSILLLQAGRTFLGVGRKPYTQPRLQQGEPNTERDTMTNESKPASATSATTIEINGGTLVRAAKICECNTPGLIANKIEEGDEWTCVCKQGWRARATADKPLHWKRISTKPRKPRTPKALPSAETTPGTEGLVPPKAG